jgi:hypothetical protein
MHQFMNTICTWCLLVHNVYLLMASFVHACELCAQEQDPDGLLLVALLVA